MYDNSRERKLEAFALLLAIILRVLHYFRDVGMFWQRLAVYNSILYKPLLCVINHSVLIGGLEIMELDWLLLVDCADS